MSGPGTGHHWSECRPVIVRRSPVVQSPRYSPPADDTEIAGLTRIVEELWSRLSEDERETFHRCCCLNSRDPEDLAVMNRIVAALRRED